MAKSKINENYYRIANRKLSTLISKWLLKYCRFTVNNTFAFNNTVIVWKYVINSGHVNSIPEMFFFSINFKWRRGGGGSSAINYTAL